MDQTTPLYSGKFLQLAKFALAPSFGETAQATGETNLPLLPRTAGERSASSVTEFIAAEGQSEAGPWMSLGTAPRMECHLYKGSKAAPSILWELA